MQRPLLPVFAVAALVFTAYAALVQFMPLRIERGQDQGDTNRMRAENYLASPGEATVLVGSSLTYRLPPAILGPDIANLAMAGGAPATGLALIDQSGERPKLVLVEINLLDRAADLAAVHSLVAFPERQLRGALRALRAGYDPVNVAERGLQALLHKADEDLVPPPDAIRQLIAGQQQVMAHPPDAGVLRGRLAETMAMVSTLQARGIRVGFFEMPIDPSLRDLPAAKMVRQAVRQRFLPGHFCWLNLSIAGALHTLDGIHLMSDDSVLVARQVVDQHTGCLHS